MMAQKCEDMPPPKRYLLFSFRKHEMSEVEKLVLITTIMNSQSFFPSKNISADFLNN